MGKSDYMLEQLRTQSADYAKISAQIAEVLEAVNQQENGAVLDAARLAMFVDTDGWITMNVRQKGIDRDCMIQPIIGLVNTSDILAEWAHDALKRLNAPAYFHRYDFSGYKGSKSWQVQNRVQITGMRRVMRVLPWILPFLVAKRRQAEVMFEYCQRRLSQPHKAKYEDIDLEQANEIRALNCNKTGAWRPVSSESIRQTHELRKELKSRGKMCSDLHGDMQSAAETSAPAA